MTWNYEYTPQIWPSIITLLMMIILAYYAWRRHTVPGATLLLIGCLFSVFWVAGSILEFSAVNIATKIFWVKFQSVWQLPAATAGTCFILEYTQPGRWLNRRNIALLSIAPILALISALTNDFHHLAWSGFIYDGSILPLRGPATWVLIAYAYGLAILNLVALIWLFAHSPPHRWPVAMIVVGQIGMHAIYLLEKAYIIRYPFPLDVAGLALMNLMYAIALFGFRIFDPIPLAHLTAIRQLREGMLVLDSQDRVVGLNPAAERFFSMAARQIKGRLFKELLPSYRDGPLADAAGTDLEFSLEAGSEIRHYSLEITPLNDFRGLHIGRLLLLHDVTGRKQAQAEQAQLLWAQATLQEREQLADELHDGLSQNLAFLNLQAQAAQVYLQAGKGKSAQASLKRLSEAADQIQVDTRELIDHLLSVSLPSENFGKILGRILEDFESQTGLAVNLAMEGEAAIEDCFNPAKLPPPVAVQLVRICQEALVNVRKHAAEASQVSVRLHNWEGRLELSIEDNGPGFDPAGLPPGGKHYGLQVMRQRAARIGGQVEIDSAPGQGTRIQVSVPLAGPKLEGLV